MLELFAQIEAAVAVIRRGWNTPPHAGIILGTGLGDLARQIDVHWSWTTSRCLISRNRPPFRTAGGSSAACCRACPWWSWKAGFTCTKATR